MRKFLQSTTRTCKIRSFSFLSLKCYSFLLVTDEPPTFKCSFNWLHWVLVAACRVFSCGVWDLVPCPGTGPGPLCWELRVLASGPAGNAATSYLKEDDLLTSGCAGPSLLCGLFPGCGARGLLTCFCAELPPLVAALAGCGARGLLTCFCAELPPLVAALAGCGARGLLTCFCAELPPLVAALVGKHRL